MKRETVMLIQNLGGHFEGTVGTLITYKDGSQALHLRGLVYGPRKVKPGDEGKLFQRTDYGVQLPIRKPAILPDGKPCGVLRRLLSPTGKVSVYWTVVTGPTLAEVGQRLEEDCLDSGWKRLLSRGYTWEPATLILRNSKGH